MTAVPGAFFLFSVAAAGTPGPRNAMLTAVGANVGVLRGLPALLGVALGMGLMASVAFGLGSLILDHPAVLRGHYLRHGFRHRPESDRDDEWCMEKDLTGSPHSGRGDLTDGSGLRMP